MSLKISPKDHRPCVEPKKFMPKAKTKMSLATRIRHGHRPSINTLLATINRLFGSNIRTTTADLSTQGIYVMDKAEFGLEEKESGALVVVRLSSWHNTKPTQENNHSAWVENKLVQVLMSGGDLISGLSLGINKSIMISAHSVRDEAGKVTGFEVGVVVE